MERTCRGIRVSAGMGLATGLLAALGFFGPVPSARAEEVRVTMDWKTKGTHASYYVALKKGYFKSEGLDIAISQGAGSVKAVQFVGSGQFQFASADFATMAKGVIRGIPVRAVFAVKQLSPMTIIALPKSGIKTLADLKGKRVAVSAGDSTSQILPGLMAKNNIPMGSFILITTAPASKIPALLEGKVDAMTGYTSNQLPIVKSRVVKQGIEPVSLRYSDYGVNLLANGIITQEDLVQKNPDRVRAFLRAAKKGWEDAIRDRKGALNVVFEYFPQSKKQSFVFSEQLDEVIRLMDSPSTKGKPMGWMARPDWVETVDLLKKYAGVKGDVPVERLYTNALIP